MKKLSSIFLAAVLAAGGLFFTGCGSQKTTLSVINFRPEDQSYYKWLEDEFEKKYPDIDLRYEAIDTAGYNQLLNSRLTGESVDVYGSQAAYVAQEELASKSLPLNDIKLENGTLLFDTLKDGDKSECSLNGDYLVAPLASYAEVVFYNKTMFEQYSKEIPATWTEFVALNDFFKSKPESEVKAPIVYGGLDVWPICMVMESIEPSTVRAKDPDFYIELTKAAAPDLNTPEFLDWMEKSRKVTEYFQPLSNGTQYSMAPGMFASGDYAMMIDGSWSLKEIYAAEPDFEIGAFIFPGSDNAAENQKAAAKVGGGFSIAKSSKNIEAAKKFIAFNFEEANYAKYINFMKANPSKKGVGIDDAVASDIAAMDTILTLSNYWSYWDPAISMRAIGPEFVGGTMTAAQAVTLFNTNLNTAKPVWSEVKALNRWYQRFSPESVIAE